MNDFEWWWMYSRMFVQGEFACLITIFHRKNEDTYYQTDDFHFILWSLLLFWNSRVKYWNHRMGIYVFTTGFTQNFYLINNSMKNNVL